MGLLSGCPFSCSRRCLGVCVCWGERGQVSFPGSESESTLNGCTTIAIRHVLWQSSPDQEYDPESALSDHSNESPPQRSQSQELYGDYRETLEEVYSLCLKNYAPRLIQLKHLAKECCQFWRKFWISQLPPHRPCHSQAWLIN